MTKDVIAWMSGTIRKLEQRIKILEASLPRVIALDDLIPALHETEIQQTHTKGQYIPKQEPTTQRLTVSFMNPEAEVFYPTGGGGTNIGMDDGGMCSGSCDMGGGGIHSSLGDFVCIGTRDMAGGGGTNSSMDDGGMCSGSSDLGGSDTNSGMVDGGVCIGIRDMGGGDTNSGMDDSGMRSGTCDVGGSDTNSGVGGGDVVMPRAAARYAPTLLVPLYRVMEVKQPIISEQIVMEHFEPLGRTVDVHIVIPVQVPQVMMSEHASACVIDSADIENLVVAAPEVVGVPRSNVEQIIQIFEPLAHGKGKGKGKGKGGKSKGKGMTEQIQPVEPSGQHLREKLHGQLGNGVLWKAIGRQLERQADHMQNIGSMAIFELIADTAICAAVRGNKPTTVKSLQRIGALAASIIIPSWIENDLRRTKSVEEWEDYVDKFARMTTAHSAF